MAVINEKKFLDTFSSLGHPYCNECLSRFVGCGLGTKVHFMHSNAASERCKCVKLLGQGSELSFTPEFKIIYHKAKEQYDI
jgi:hypothetical protein